MQQLVLVVVTETQWEVHFKHQILVVLAVMDHLAVEAEEQVEIQIFIRV